MHEKSTVTHWEHAWQQRTSIPIDHHDSIVNMLLHYLGPLEGKRVLEVGAGSARDSARLAELGANAFAIDYSCAALGIAREVSSLRGARLMLTQADTFQLPFGDCTFDAVFSQGLLEHFTDPQAAIREQSRVLKPGGRLLVDVPQKYNLYSLYKWYRIKRGLWFAGWETAYSLSDLERMTQQAGLEAIDSYGWMYSPSFFFGFRNLHTFDERHKMIVWIPSNSKRSIERFWSRLERMRWYYRWLACVGVVARKPATGNQTSLPSGRKWNPLV